MNKFIGLIKTNISLPAALLSVVLVTGVGFVAPKVGNVTEAEDCTSIINVPTVANLNSPNFPVDIDPATGRYPSTAGSDCSDFANIAVRNLNTQEYGSTDTAQPGDELYVRIYVHDTAQQGLNPAQTTAQNVHGNISISGNTISTTFMGDNTNTVNGSVSVSIPSGSSLQIEPGTGEFFNYQAVQISGNDNLTASGGTFNMGNMQACFEFSEFYRIKVKVVAPVAPKTPTGTITGTVGGKIGSQCLFDGTVNWSTQNVTQAEVFVVNPDTNQEGAFASGPSGNSDAPWIQPGKSYTFNLYDLDNGQKLLLAHTVLSTSQTCGTTPPATYSVNLTLDSTSYCVYSKGDGTNQTATYTVQGSSNLAGDDIVWSSTKNGQPTGESNDYYGQNLNSSAYWSGPASSAWNTSEIGSWTKTASIFANGKILAISQPFAFTVKDCSQTKTPTGTITGTVGGKIGSQCLFDGTVNWSTQNVTQAEVFVVNPDTNQEGAFASGPSGNSDAPWIQPGKSYTFNLYDLDNGQKLLLAHTVLSTSQTCGTTPPATYSVNLTLDSTSYCVYSKGDGTNQTATYTVQGSSNLAGDDIVWSSTKNGQPTGESNDYYGQNLNSSAYWSGPASSAWNTSEIGSWTKTASIFANGKILAISQPFAFTVKDCSTTPPICTANSNFALNASTPVKSGSTYSVTLTWTSTGSNQVKIVEVNPGSSSETTITTGPNTGSFTVTGLQAGQSYTFKMYDAICGGFLTSTQVITPANPGQLVCSANVSSANIGDDVLFTASGGSGSYTWATSNNSNAGSGSLFNVNFASAGNKSVTVSSADGQTASCGVSINAPVQQTSTGNCNNDSNSCNNNNNTNNQTSNGNNSSNQNNQNNINGNNNVVTNTNNNCVNNSCNTTSNVVYITSGGTVVPANQYSQISITKQVRDLNAYNSFSNSASANNGDTVQFQIVVSNSNSAVANNVRLTDSLPSGLSLVSGTVEVGGSNVSDGNLYNGMYLGNLSSGQSFTVTFEATVNSGSGSSIQNTASATSDNAGSVQASAWVFVNNSGNVIGGNVNLTYSKTAYNNTKNVNATTAAASRGDSITYTLTVSNTGNVPANSFIITDDLSQVLPYASIIDNGGGTLSGNVISYPGITVPAGGSVSRSFEVSVNSALASNLSYVMSNTYGNTINISINAPQVLGAFTAPKTGADTNAFIFSGLLTAGAALLKKRKILAKLIFS